MRHLNTLATIGAAVAASVVFVPSAAEAVVITQTVTLSSLLTDWNARSSAFSLFNTNLGTLTKVDVTFRYAATSNLTVQNNTIDTASGGTVRFESALTVAGSSLAMTTALNTALNAFGFIDSNDDNRLFIIDKISTSKAYTLAAGASTIIASSFSTQTVSGAITSGVEMALFSKSGGGTDNLFNDTLTTTLLSNTGGNTSATQSTLGSGSFTIDYTYTEAPPPPPPAPPVGTPEPASMALLGMGLVGLGAAVRRRRRT